MVVSAALAARPRRILAVGVVILALGPSACAYGDGDQSAAGPGEASSTAVREGDRALEARPARRAGPPEAERPVSVRLPSGTQVTVRPAPSITRNPGRRGVASAGGSRAAPPSSRGTSWVARTAAGSMGA